MPVLTESKLPLPLLRKGKVREVYEADRDHLLLVASDRVSAFDIVMREAIPRKGAVLTQISAFWFELLGAQVPSHFVTARTGEIVRRFPALAAHRAEIAGRTMLVRRTTPVAFECVVRGYLSGSAWKEYKESGTLAGEALPGGLVESARLEPPVFSPATKEEAGHDINVTFSTMATALGPALAIRLRDASFGVYGAGRDYAATRGIIIADTKFELGRIPGTGELVLCDEVLTPDSSRFWPVAQWKPGATPPSFDKQPVRDYLETLDWDKTPPPPPLPREVVDATSTRYVEAYERITGRKFTDWPGVR